MGSALSLQSMLERYEYEYADLSERINPGRRNRTTGER